MPACSANVFRTFSTTFVGFSIDAVVRPLEGGGVSGRPNALKPHRRYNPLNGSHVLVSPQRMSRPWQGQVEPTSPGPEPAYDPGCYLCPGNARANGTRNPAYSGPFVFANDFAALTPEAEEIGRGGDGLLQSQGATGEARVLCFSPDHSATLAELPLAAVRAVVDAWCGQAEELGHRYRWVQIFENRGAAMGCSNPHPHGQIWATDYLPDEPAGEDIRQRAWLAEHGTPLLAELVERELTEGERIVCLNPEWLAIVPYWAAWPFETLLLPRFPVARLPDLGGAQREALAAILRELVTRYDNLFETVFPYSMGWHGAPFGSDSHGWRLHAHFYPPLLRSATVRKFMVGFEMLAEPQRDLTPEEAAARLRAAATVHFRSRA